MCFISTSMKKMPIRKMILYCCMILSKQQKISCHTNHAKRHCHHLSADEATVKPNSCKSSVLRDGWLHILDMQTIGRSRAHMRSLVSDRDLVLWVLGWALTIESTRGGVACMDICVCNACVNWRRELLLCLVWWTKSKFLGWYALLWLVYSSIW